MYRGRGRGRFGGGFKRGQDKPFESFPDLKLPDQKSVQKDTYFAKYNFILHEYWLTSPYRIGEASSEASHSHDIERYSDRKRPRNQFKQQDLVNFMKLEPGYFPLELIKGEKVRRAPKKVKWSTDTDPKMSDFFKKLDSRSQKEGEGDEEEEQEEEEEEEEEQDFSDDGDYEQNRDFDDDDDDYNDDDGGDDEPYY